MRGFIKFIITLAIIAGVIYGGYRFVMHTIYTHTYVAIDVDASADDYFVLEIEPGMRAADVIDILFEEELIRNDLIAGLLVRFHRWGAIQVGEYHVYAGLSLEEMFEMFRGGSIVDQAFIYVIIPEGFEITQIAEIFANNEALDLEMDDDELLALWSDVDFLTELIEEYWFLTDEILDPALIHPLEGYFYPIRHEIPEDFEDERHMTRTMLRMTERMLARYRTQIEEHEMTFHEILAFAAIVQGETADTEDMPTVAGVFFNRIAADHRLESCVTVQYLADERAMHVTDEMRWGLESPFNTYLNLGIPPGAVNSPSRAAINATLNPEDHNFFFFIGDIFNCVDGGTHFFTYYYQHRDFQQRYLEPSYANNSVSVCE